MSLISFDTERLQLKPTSENDADFIFTLFNSPGWIKYIGDRNVYSQTDAQIYIRTKITPQFERIGFGNYTVVRKSDNAKIGTCGLIDREGLPCIDIGFAFLPEYGKSGYAFEAAQKLKEIAFQTFKLKELCAITAKDNIPSQRLLFKLGLRSEGTINLPGDTTELMYFTINNPKAD